MKNGSEKDMKRIAILIPCYNEGATIKKVVEDFKSVLPEATIYVYDNNSTDGTAEIARDAGAVVRHEYRQGKGNVIRSMFRDIEADCYLMIDGDDTYPAEHAKMMVDLVLNKGVDMVIGNRLSTTYFTENKRRFHNLGNRTVRFFINKLFGNEIKDIMTGYRAFSHLFVKSFPVLSKGFEIETEMTIHAVDKNFLLEEVPVLYRDRPEGSVSHLFVKSFPVLSKGFEIETEMTIHAVDKNFLLEEVPVLYRDRPEGSVSKLNTISDGMKVLRTIVTLFREYRPFTFFSVIAIVLWGDESVANDSNIV